MAPVSESPQQLSLFTSLAKFQVGDVVRQTSGRHGHFGIAYVYFHIHAWELHGEGMDYLCYALPYGSCPEMGPSWLEENSVVGLGFNWPVPEGTILRYYRQGMLMPNQHESGWPRQYMETLANSICQSTWVGGASPYSTHMGGPGECPWPYDAPFSWEQDLVEFLDTQPVKWWEVSRENWYEKFPQDVPT